MALRIGFAVIPFKLVERCGYEINCLFDSTNLHRGIVVAGRRFGGRPDRASSDHHESPITHGGAGRDLKDQQRSFRRQGLPA